MALGHLSTRRCLKWWRSREVHHGRQQIATCALRPTGIFCNFSRETPDSAALSSPGQKSPQGLESRHASKRFRIAEDAGDPSGHHKTSVLPEAALCFFPQTASSVSDCSLTSCSQLIARHPRFAPDPDTRLQPPSANLADGENQTHLRCGKRTT